MPFKHLILCHSLLLLPLNFASIRVFSNESTFHIRWPEYWSFSFSISPSSVYSGLISFRIDWVELIAVQGTLKSILQHSSSKGSIFGTQLSLWFHCHIHNMTTGKNIPLTIWTFVGKVMSLFFNSLSRFVTTILPRGKRLLI